MTLIGNYCDLAVSVDYYDTYNQERNEKAGRLFAEIGSSLSFIDSEITAQDEAVLREAIETATANKHYLENILRSKPHQLHPETERCADGPVPDPERSLPDLQHDQAGGHEIRCFHRGRKGISPGLFPV